MAHRNSTRRKRRTKPKVGKKNNTKLGWTQSGKNINTLRKLEAVEQNEKEVNL